MRNPNVGSNQSRNLGPMANMNSRNNNGIQNRSGMSKPSMADMRAFDRASYFADMKSGAPTKSQLVGFLGGAKSAAGLAQKLNDMLPPEHKITSEKVKGFAIDKVQDIFKTGTKSGGAFNPTVKDSERNVMNSSYGLSKAPNPKPVNLNSGIAPNTSSKDQMISITDLCSPLHVTAVGLSIGCDSLVNYFKSTIAFDIQTRAQANVNFNLNLSTQFTSTQIYTAYNVAINALQVYYYYTSILSYESNTKNKNDGMTNLRNKITAQQIVDITLLGRRLEDTPIPPRLVEWVRYMNMNFLSGDSQGAAIIKTVFDVNALDTYPATTYAATALANLTTDANSTVFSLVRRAIPQWRVGTLYDVPTVPVYDRNFLTIFANLPTASTTTGGALTFSRTTASRDTVISYNSFNNRLDGVAFAMGGIFDSVLGGNVPGMTNYSLSGTTKFSQRSWYDVGGGAAWQNTIGSPFLLASRQESYSRATRDTAVELTPHLYGADKCQNVTANAMLQTATNVLDFLFNVDSIPRNGKLSSFNKRGNNRI